MLVTLFERCMKRRGVKETDPFDWEKTEENNADHAGGEAKVVNAAVPKSELIKKHKDIELTEVKPFVRLILSQYLTVFPPFSETQSDSRLCQGDAHGADRIDQAPERQQCERKRKASESGRWRNGNRSAEC